MAVRGQDTAGSMGALAKQLADGTARVATVSQEKVGSHTPHTYGTVPTSFYRITSAQFLPYSSSVTYADDGGSPPTTFHRHPTAGFDFLGSPNIPSGALLNHLEIDYCNTSASSHMLAALFGCDYLGNNCVDLSGILDSGAGGTGCFLMSTDLTSAAWSVDNNFNELMLVMEPGATDGTVSFAGAIIGYVLQVSPAPGTATFNDVPTSDPAFQFIEAFNAAGITTGCSVSPPLYCPDGNVTRRQMAVFFAKALGLQFN